MRAPQAAGDAAAMARRKRRTCWETGGTEPGRLPTVAEPTAYLTG